MTETIPYDGVTSIHRLQKPPMTGQDRLKGKKPTRENPLIISASELRDFLRCRVKHNWRHHQRLIPKSGAPALAMGGLIHEILETWNGLPPDRRTRKAMERIATKRFSFTTPEELTVEDLELIQAMTIGFSAFIKPYNDEVGLKVSLPERWFALPLLPDKSIIVRGKIDNVFEPTRRYKHAVMNDEYKSKSQIRVDAVEMMLQITIYLWALRRLYPKKKRYLTRYIILRKQLPTNRVTAPLFHCETVEREPDQIEQWAEDTRRIAMDMADAAIYPNPTEDCAWDCDFKIPCLLRGNTTDLRHVLQTQYKKKERNR